MIVSWNVALCSVILTDVSEVLTASIRAMTVRFSKRALLSFSLLGVIENLDTSLNNLMIVNKVLHLATASLCS
jgi:hypothetical protein